MPEIGDQATPLNDVELEMAALYTSHAAGLLRYAFTLINDACAAQDALQEIFLRYFVARTEGRQFDDPRAWLFRVLRNHLLDTLKSSSVKNEVTIEGMQDPPDRGEDPETRYHRAEMARDLTRLLAPRELECVRLRAEGLKYDEIADVLDLSQGTVGATLARAHRKIRRALGRAEGVKAPVLPNGCTPVREENSYSS